MPKRKGTIVSYTHAELDAMKKRGLGRTDWDKVLSMSQEEANRLAEEDSPWLKDDDFWAIKKSAKRTKKISLALEPEVATFYESLGKRGQETMNAVLKAHMLVQEHRV